MPDLRHSLQDHDLGHLRIVAGFWGFDLRANDRDAAMTEILAAANDAHMLAEVVDTLRPPAREALSALVEAGGRIPWAAFSRQYGEIREMGTAKRDREQPYLNSPSVAEDLFYRALVGRAFFETGQGVQEFAYIPEDALPPIRDHLPKSRHAPAQPLGRPAAHAEAAVVMPANDRILDDMTTLLAARRIGRATAPDPVLEALAKAAGLLRDGSLGAPQAKAFLEASRPAALRMLIHAWRVSETFNELRLIPGLICEGEWSNHPLSARRFLLDLLAALPKKTWWSLNAFVAAVKEQQADFQRPAGDYDSWFIKRAAEDRYLRGFADWDLVDGALIRYLITDVMHRLGMVDLASEGEGTDPFAFRLLDIQQLAPRFPEKESDKLQISSQGKITASRLVPRAARYQVARFCEWDGVREDEYRYRATPGSLTKARQQGLRIEHLLAVLAKHSGAGIPPALVKALKRWEANGTEARTEAQVVLRVSRPEIIKQLRASKAARFLGEPLGPASIIVKHGAAPKVTAALAEMGILAEDSTDAGGVLDPEASVPRARQPLRKDAANHAGKK